MIINIDLNNEEENVVYMNFIYYRLYNLPNDLELRVAMQAGVYC